MKYDSFYIKFGGMSDDGFHDATVFVGFAPDQTGHRGDVEIPVRLKADLSVSLRELREQAKVLALEKLQEAAQLLEQFSADQLHSKAQDVLAESRVRDEADFQQSLSAKLDGFA